MTMHVPRRRTPVPAEHRVLGLDRRTFLPAAVVVAVFLVLTVVVPRVDAAIDWDDPVRAGEQLALTDTIVLTPVTGWDVEAGFRADTDASGPASGAATVAGDGVTLEVTPGSFDGTPAELLDQVEKVTSRTGDPTFRVSSDRATIVTSAGRTGVSQSYSSLHGDGLVAAFVLGGTGLKITAYGPPAQLSAASEDVRAMIRSIRVRDGADS